MQNTEYLGLNKPESTDFYNVNDFNENFDTIDGKFKNLSNIDNTADKDKRVKYAESATRADKLSNAVKINGVEFDGTQDITISDSERSIITDTATGENITVTNSADAPVRSLKVDGKTEQFTTKGYQLFDASKLPTKTQGGATVINNGDGSFTISGSGALTDNISINHTFSCNKLKSGNVTLKCNSATYPYCSVVISSSGGSVQITNRWGNGETKQLTDAIINGDNLTIMMQITGAKGDNIVAGTIKPVLYQDGDGTYEPYTNGASPNPDYPQDIKGVCNTYDMEVTVTGKNLLDITTFYNANYEGANIDGDNIIIPPGSNRYGIYFSDVCNDLKVGKTYTFSVESVNEHHTDYGWRLKYVDGTYSELSKSLVLTKNITQKVERVYFYAFYGQTTTSNTVISKLQIEENTVATEFEEYKSQSILVPNVSHLYDGDYFTLKGGRLEIVRNNARVEFDGSENIQKHPTISTTNAFYVENLQRYSQKGAYCTHYTLENKADVEKDSIYLGTRLHFLTELSHNYTTVNSFKAYLAEQYTNDTPVTVVYKLAEPTIEVIDTDLDLSTYCNVTHITNTDNAHMEVEYFTNSANGGVVGELQEQVKEKADVTDLKNYIMVEKFEKKVNVNGGRDDIIDISIKDGYTPIFCKIDPYSIDIVCNHSTLSDGLIEYTLSNLNDDPIECTVVATVIYVKNI